MGFNLKGARLVGAGLVLIPKYYPAPRALTFSAFTILLCLTLENDIKISCYLEHAVCQLCVSTWNTNEKERMKRKKRVDEGKEVDFTVYGRHRHVNLLLTIQCNECLICSGFLENRID